MSLRRAARAATLLAAFATSVAVPEAGAQPFERITTDVGDTGLALTNVGTAGRPGIGNDPGGTPSFEYPLDSGIEHLFEAGLWVGARRADGVVSVRTGSVTTAGGYAPGAPGFEFAQADLFTQRSSLPTSPFFSPQAVSQQDLLTAYVDTAAVLPGTNTPVPDVQNQLGIEVQQRAYAWSFPFTEYFVIVEYEVRNVSAQPITDVWVGLWEDLVVRNVVTTTDGGGAFFNKGGRGFLGYPDYEGGTGALTEAAPDSQFVTYAFNAGGVEESLNTYGAIAFLGAEWDDPGGAGRSAERRFFHPFVADEYAALGLPAPRLNPRWWLFGGNDPDPALARPADDLERYQRMQEPYPNPLAFGSDAEYEAFRDAYLGDGQGEGRLQVDGQTSAGNWIGVNSVGPFPELAPGQSVTVTFAYVAALKPEEFQGTGAPRAADTEASRAILRNNVFWAQETYAGEDANYNGRLDAGEDLNGNGLLDRYLIPEPPASPQLRVELEAGRAVLYWTDDAEASVDPVTGRTDFEGYRIYRSDPGDDREGNILGKAGLIAQYDTEGNDVGFNNGFEAVRLGAPATFDDEPGVAYTYRFEAAGLLDGWQYAFAVTAFDAGDTQSGLAPLESSRASNAVRVFPGTEAAADAGVGVFPNPYRVRAAWDGPLSTQRKLYFYGLPPRCQIRVYTLAGEIVTEMDHDAATYTGDTRWFDDFSADGREVAGGVHAWDLLSDNALRLSSGLYLFSVQDLDSGDTQTGKFVILR
ncbi:MAG: hypothetical protein AAGJ11_13200 [Bacteroidota bacterium]